MDSNPEDNGKKFTGANGGGAGYAHPYGWDTPDGSAI